MIKRSYFRSEFALRVHSFMLSVEEFEETGKLGNLFPDLFKLFSYCWMKDVSDIFCFSRFPIEDYKDFKTRNYFRLPSELKKHDSSINIDDLSYVDSDNLPF